MVGVSSAIHLQRRGWAVILIDRREPGRETSYGNSGVIQSEAVRPYAMPRDPRMLVDIALGRTNDVHYRLLSLPAHVRPLLKYWWHSASSRYRSISIAYSRLVASATADHGELIREAQADHLIRRGGYRVFACGVASNSRRRNRLIAGIFPVRSIGSIRGPCPILAAWCLLMPNCSSAWEERSCAAMRTPCMKAALAGRLIPWRGVSMRHASSWRSVPGRLIF